MFPGRLPVHGLIVSDSRGTQDHSSIHILKVLKTDDHQWHQIPTIAIASHAHQQAGGINEHHAHVLSRTSSSTFNRLAKDGRHPRPELILQGVAVKVERIDPHTTCAGLFLPLARQTIHPLPPKAATPKAAGKVTSQWTFSA